MESKNQAEFGLLKPRRKSQREGFFRDFSMVKKLD